MEKRNRRFAREDIIAIEELAEQLSSELDNDDLGFEGGDDDVDTTVPIIEDAPSKADDVVAAAEELLGSVPDDKPDPVVTGCENNEAKEVLGEAEKLEQEIACKEETDNVLAEADELEDQINSCIAGDTCPDCGKEKCECGKVASEFAPGIEDEIGDEAHGGDPSVSDIVDNGIDVSTDKEVFGQNTDSEYVAKITARLDRVATALEKRGMKKMAFRVDQLSDRLEASIR